MAFDGKRAAENISLTKVLIQQLQSGLDAIAAVDDDSYRQCGEGRGSIGAHIRHNINFADAVIEGAVSGTIDYARRSRDARIENDREFASAKIEGSIDRLENVPMDQTREVTVISEIDPAVSFQSTLGREIEFVISHTVHHYALIKERLDQAGITLDRKFGVAPSTLEYWRTIGQ